MDTIRLTLTFLLGRILYLCFCDLYAEVKNTNDLPIDVKLITIFYDDKGSVIFVTSVYAAVPIAPGEKARVWIIVAPEFQGNITNYELMTRGELSSSGYTDFETFNVVYHEGVDGSRGKVSGEVRNIGNKSINNVYVFVSLYNTEGKIIYYTSTGVHPGTLGPGETGTFEFSEPLSPWQMPNYSLIVRRSK